jgi:hypothetical protein
MAIYAKTSPYANTKTTESYLDIIEFRNLPNESDDVLFEITAQYAYRPDLLAYDLYKDSALWWVFSVRNKDIIRDPIYDMIAGKKIYLPKLSTMTRVLGV